MAGIKISSLPAATSALMTDVYPVDQLPGPVTYKESNAQLFSLFQTQGQALSEFNDTNVTLSLGGNPTIALLNAASITAGWTGTLSPARGGTGENNGSNTLTLGGPLITSGAYTSTFTITGTTTVTFPTSGTLATTSGSVITVNADSGSATPSSGMLTISGGTTGLTTVASGSTVDLTGTLGLGNGGTNHALTASAGGIVWSDSSKLNILAGTSTANQMLISGDAVTPSWTTNTWPSTDSKGDLLYASAANTIGGLGVGSTGNILTIASGLPAWTTATYPATTTINQLLYSSANNVVGAVTAGDYGVLISSSSGVPSWLANGTTGQLLTATTSGTPSWENVAASSVTFTGDTGTPFSGAAVTVTGGTSGLSVAASTPDLTIGGTLKLSNGGTNASLTASNGGIFYSTASAGAILSGTATATQMLQSGSSTTPAWSTSTWPATTTINQLLYSSSANTVAGLATATTAVLTTSSGVPTWASELSLALGGTNANLTASNGGIFYSTASAGAILSATATATQMLQSGASGAPAWSTTTWPATSTINQLLYSSSANTVVGLSTANNGILVTSAGGVPSIGNTVGAGLTMPSITFNTTTGVVGTTTNNSAAAGSVGELVSSVIPLASAVSLTSPTAANVTSISLTAGDWDVWGNVFFNNGGVATIFAGWISTTSATIPNASLLTQIQANSSGTSLLATGTPVPSIPLQLSGTTTVYLSAVAVFTTSTVTACGGIYARRRR